MRCYQCEKTAPVLFPILKETGRGQHAVTITAYVCAACIKEIQKQLREEAKQ